MLVKQAGEVLPALLNSLYVFGAPVPAQLPNEQVPAVPPPRLKRHPSKWVQMHWIRTLSAPGGAVAVKVSCCL